jgi:hypothetical protein
VGVGPRLDDATYILYIVPIYIYIGIGQLLSTLTLTI